MLCLFLVFHYILCILLFDVRVFYYFKPACASAIPYYIIYTNINNIREPKHNKWILLIPDMSNITVHAFVEGGRERRNRTTIQLNVLPQSQLDCDLIIQDLCYWQSVSYQIYENRKPAIIGSLSSPYLAEMCSDYKLNYTLLSGKSLITLKPIRVLPKLDSVKFRVSLYF